LLVQDKFQSRLVGLTGTLGINAALVTLALLPIRSGTGDVPRQHRALLVFSMASPSSGLSNVLVAKAAMPADRHDVPRAPVRADRPSSRAAFGVAVSTDGASQISGEGRGVFAGALESQYQDAVRSRIMRFSAYPEAGIAGQMRGLVRVRIDLARDGSIKGAWIESSSGFDPLDEAALEAIHQAVPLPPIPSDLPDELEFSVPLDFSPPQLARAGMSGVATSN
jgi:TonB family protein